MSGGPQPLPTTGASGAASLGLLRNGEMEILGRLVEASNTTLFAAVRRKGAEANCVYKPVAGERPLWDFPHGSLADREVAAYLVSEETGWGIVPPTVLRDGPFGPGMCQLWIDVDESVDLVALARSDHSQLRRMAVFDAVVNNADRKGGHLLPTPEGHVYGVDHGVCFHVDDKLRTILWRWRGQRLTSEAVDVLSRLRAELADPTRERSLAARLRRHLTSRELRATVRRVDRLLATGRHPQPGDDWPPIPWPPF